MLLLIIHALLWSQVRLVAAKQLKVVESDIIHLNNLQASAFVPIIQVAMGSPAQKVMAILDTGSSDLVVPQTGSPICKDPQQQCAGTKFVAGSFDPTESADVADANTVLNTSFVNGAAFQGEFLKTTVTIGDGAVADSQMGLISNGTLPAQTPLFPIFGVGPIQGEAVPPPNYQNLPAHMKDAGLIKSNAFGLYLNDFRSDKGSVVFGGIDTAKFTGKLREAPLIPDNLGTLPSFVVDFSSLKLAAGNGTAMAGCNGTAMVACNGTMAAPANGSAVPAMPAMVMDLAPKAGLPVSLVDSGNPGVSIPAESLKTLAKALGTTFSDQDGLGAVDCKLVSSGSMLMFGFNKDNAKIMVPLELLLVPQSLTGPGVCQLALDPSADIASLGAPFLQAAYTVFDMDQKRLLFAQAVLNSTVSKVEEFPGAKVGGMIQARVQASAPARVRGVGARTYTNKDPVRRSKYSYPSYMD